MTVRRRTTLNLDMELVAEAQSVLGTAQVTDTVHRALRDVVDRDRRRQLLAMGRGDLTPERLDEMRRNRSFEPRESTQPA
jgi:Arc/MetJ family transcription regulator